MRWRAAIMVGACAVAFAAAWLVVAGRPADPPPPLRPGGVAGVTALPLDDGPPPAVTVPAPAFVPPPPSSEAQAAIDRMMHPGDELVRDAAVKKAAHDGAAQALNERGAPYN